MRLADFILGNIELILSEWETFARSLAPGTTMTRPALRDDAKAMLLETAQDMQIDQSPAEQESKSKGQGGVSSEESDRLDRASVRHGVDRVESGFDIVEVVSEYRALRASVLRLWIESNPHLDISDVNDITRFNESIDQSLAAAIDSYTNRVDQSRCMFLAILGHDLRNPLNCISMATQLVSRTANQDPSSARALSIIETNTEAVTGLIGDLIDFASTGLGSAMPLTRGPVDLETLCRKVFEGFCLAHPQRTLRCYINGDLTGDWDAARIRQVVANLMGNAIQHGATEEPIELSVTSDRSTVVLTVHNGGPPIPPELLATIFDPLKRLPTPASTAQRITGSVGLGLYIVREIVVAHGGTVEVASTAQAGTMFTVRLPRSPAAEGDR